MFSQFQHLLGKPQNKESTSSKGNKIIQDFLEMSLFVHSKGSVRKSGKSQGIEKVSNLQGLRNTE